MAAQNRTILVTGATSGFGAYIAHKLASQGSHVLLHGRNEGKLTAVASKLRTEFPQSHIDEFLADFSDLRQVAKLATDVTKQYMRLGALVNNAGVGFGKPGATRKVSENGYELRFAVNYLAPYLLTRRLLPILKQAPTAQIINVASIGQQALDFNDLMLEHTYDGITAYQRSKLALIMFTFDLAEELRDTHVTVNAIHPATYADTNMLKEAGITAQSSVAEGGEAVVGLLTEPVFGHTTGEFINRQRPTRANEQAYDVPTREQLREVTEDLVGGF